MHLDEADKRKLGALLPEAKKQYGHAALERLEEAFAVAIGSKQPVGTEDPLRIGTVFFFAVTCF